MHKHEAIEVNRLSFGYPPNMAESRVDLSREEYERRLARATKSGIDITLRIVAADLNKPLAHFKRHCYERANLPLEVRGI